MQLEIQNPRQWIYDTQYATKRKVVSLTTSFILRNYSNKNGENQIYLHIYSENRRKRIAMGISIAPSKWNKKKQRCRGEEFQDTNLVLDNIEASITEIKTQFRLSKTVLTLDKFLEEFQSDFSRLDFLAFFNTHLTLNKRELAPGTFRRYNSVYNKLKEWKGKIYFSDITYPFIEKIRMHLKSLGNCENTISSNMAAIRKYLRLAKKYGIHYPLEIESLKVKPQTSNRVSLEPTEVKRLFKYYESEFISPEKRLVLGYFLFICFTGLRRGDLLALKRESITDRFQITVKKTKKFLTINLPDKAIKILELEPRLFLVPLTGEYINREIKIIAAACNIKKKISMHIGRHTFATNYIRMGGSVVYLKKLLGHSKISTTMIYESITEEEQNKDIHLLDNLF